MRKPFRESAEALKAKGYEVRDTLYHIVFGGVHVAVEYYAGGAYYNRGRNYVSAQTRALARDYDAARRAAVQEARTRHPDLFSAIEYVPRSEAQERSILEAAAKLDDVVATIYPRMVDEETKKEAEKQAVQRDRSARAEREAAVDNIGRELVAEVLRLYEDHLLDTNALASLKDIAQRLTEVR